MACGDLRPRYLGWLFWLALWDVFCGGRLDVVIGISSPMYHSSQEKKSRGKFRLDFLFMLPGIQTELSYTAPPSSRNICSILCLHVLSQPYSYLHVIGLLTVLDQDAPFSIRPRIIYCLRWRVMYFLGDPKPGSNLFGFLSIKSIKWRNNNWNGVEGTSKPKSRVARLPLKHPKFRP